MTSFALTKRQKIIITSGILSFELISVWFAPISFYITYKYIFLGCLTASAYLMSVWALWQGLSKLKAVMLTILPTLFTLSMANYFFLLSARWLTIPAMLLFGLIFYTLLLSQNVFNVASIRTIPLYRAASTTVFVLTLITSFILFNVVFSFNLSFILNGSVVFFFSALLILPVLWSLEMENINSLIASYTVVLSLAMGEVAMALSFWPIFHPMAALMLSTVLFITLGISTHVLKDRLQKGMVWEYIAWGVLIFAVALLTTSWTG